MKHSTGHWLVAFISVSTLVSAASATFHRMQIEQVIGGVNGDPLAQAIQLRQRSQGQHLVSEAKLMCYDAAGQNPVLIIDMTSDVKVGDAGARILIVSAALATNPAITPDFVMTNTIPASYLAAGSLTFESDRGTVLWRICWGGPAYTGPTSISPDNDGELDGTIAPYLPGALQATTLQALRFNGAFSAAATNNLAQYQVTAGAAILTNNAGQSGTVIAPAPCEGDTDNSGSVDVDDLVAVILDWGCTTTCDADVNDSGEVDVDDLVIVILNWGPC